jgi:hypothetical protein
MSQAEEQEAPQEKTVIGARVVRLVRPVVRSCCKIVFDHFDYIVDQWEEFQRRKQGG